MISATLGLLLLLVHLTVLLLVWRWWHFSYFSRLGIPGPRPNLLWGNLVEYHSTDLYKVIGRWIEKYGDTFGGGKMIPVIEVGPYLSRIVEGTICGGSLEEDCHAVHFRCDIPRFIKRFYNGDVPFVVTLDFDLIEYVFVRNFKNFMNRGLTMATVQRHPYLGTSLLNATAPHWRSIRGAVAGGFTSAKLRLMMPDLEEDVNVLLCLLEQHANTSKEVNMLRIYEPLAMDFIGRRCFGSSERFQVNADHPLIGIIKHTARNTMTGAIHMLGQCITSFGPLMMPLCYLTLLRSRFRSTRQQVLMLIEKRKKDPLLRKPDCLQNLTEAKYVERVTCPGGNKEKNGILKSRSLTDEEVFTCAGTLCLAGFETMASSLSYLTFTLAQHPDVQEKVRHEIREVIRDQGTLDYDTVMKRLNYLEQVMNETLRLYPPGLIGVVSKLLSLLIVSTTKGDIPNEARFVTRTAEQDFEYKGIKFKAGTCFLVPLYQMQRDSRFWTDPLNFKPDRFSTENEGTWNKSAFVAFGIGPRNCVGVKMAVLNMKYTMAKLVQKYSFQLGPSQMGEMNLDSHAMVSIPSEGPWIIFRHAEP